MTDVRIINAEALRVGPDERLIVRVKDDSLSPEFMRELSQALDDIGLKDRALVIAGLDVQFIVASAEHPEIKP